MADSGYFLRDEPVPVGYVRTPSELRENNEFRPPRGSPAGGAYSTMGEMRDFANAFLGYRLLSSEVMEAVKSGKVPAPDGMYAYGFGFGSGIRDSEPGEPPTVWQDGGAPGVGAERRIWDALTECTQVVGREAGLLDPNDDGKLEPVLRQLASEVTPDPKRAQPKRGRFTELREWAVNDKCALREHPRCVIEDRQRNSGYDEVFDR